jgi:hypothetical protein
MRSLSTLLLFAITAFPSVHGQSYCAPSFQNGCFLWRNQSVDAGTIAWVADADCTNSDHTALSTSVVAGSSLPMTVVSGNWTGCAVWVDLNNDLQFQDEENLYYSYVGGDPNYSYVFQIAIPPGIPEGNYRMRVIAPWGSDGFLSSNTNGYGPCGVYQYGNFDDFTLNVVMPTATEREWLQPAPLRISAAGSNGAFILHGEGRLLRLLVLAADGRVLKEVVPHIALEGHQLDLGELPAAPYVIHCHTDQGTRVARVVKQ